MGIVKFGGGVAVISGKVGGTVFARNKTGAIARNWTKPINPNSSKQQVVRNEFAFLVSQWKALSAADQQAWVDMAPQYPYINRVGEQSEYTGQQLYIHLNRNIQIIGGTLLDRPATPGTFSDLLLNALTMETTAGVLTTAEVGFVNGATAGESVVIQITATVSGGITKPAKGLFRQVQVEQDGSTVSDVDVLTNYLALYGSPAVGDKIFVRAYMTIENTGQTINLGQTSTTVTGT